MAVYDSDYCWWQSLMFCSMWIICDIILWDTDVVAITMYRMWIQLDLMSKTPANVSGSPLAARELPMLRYLNTSWWRWVASLSGWVFHALLFEHQPTAVGHISQRVSLPCSPLRTSADGGGSHLSASESSMLYSPSTSWQQWFASLSLWVVHAHLRTPVDNVGRVPQHVSCMVFKPERSMLTERIYITFMSCRVWVLLVIT
jgi:hypothetical protein